MTENWYDEWSWFGWLPNDSNFDEFGEPSGDHFVLYLGDRVEWRKKVKRMDVTNGEIQS